MPATLTPPRTLPDMTTGRCLWLAIPGPVRRMLRARVPLDCQEHGGGESLIVSVGSGTPLKWLHVGAVADGALVCRLWEVRQKTKKLAEHRTTADGLTAVLQRWAKEFGLGEGG